MGSKRTGGGLITTLTYGTCVANVIFALGVLVYLYCYFFADMAGKSICFMGGLWFLAAGAVVSTRAIVMKTRRVWIRSVPVIWLTTAAYTVIALDVWLRQLRSSCESIPPLETFLFGGLAVANTLAVLANWPTSPMKVLRERRSLSIVLTVAFALGTVALSACFGHLILDLHRRIESQMLALGESEYGGASQEWRDGSVITLDFTGIEITDRHLECLTRFPMLERLVLNDTTVSDVGIASTRHVPKLRELRLRGTRVTDLCAVHIAALRSLEWIDLAETAATDEVVHHLTSMPALRSVGVADTFITDESLRSLSAIRTLDTINAIGTFVTEGGIEEMSLRRPDVRVYWDGDPGG